MALLAEAETVTDAANICLGAGCLLVGNLLLWSHEM